MYEILYQQVDVMILDSHTNIQDYIKINSNSSITNFTYDANGNITQKIKGIEWWKYYYDYENRLTEAEYFDGTQTTILGEYCYDSDGKRIKKQENGETTVYIYTRIQVIYEKNSWELNIMGAIPQEYVSRQGSIIFNVNGYGDAFIKLYGGLPPSPPSQQE